MEIKLLDVKDAVSAMITSMNWTFAEGKELRDCIEDLVKEVQRNAIEITVQRCSEEADADYNILDRDVIGIHDATIEMGTTPIECYVINSSILDCKQKLFKENNLI